MRKYKGDNMGFDYSVLQQKPNNWLSTNIRYEGAGSAEFLDPKGRIWGPTTVSFDESCQYKIEMNVEGLESEQKLPLGLHQLLSGDKPKDDGGKLTLSFPPTKQNLCTKLTVRTEDGTFIAENIKFVSWSFGWNVDVGSKETVIFFPSKSKFDAANPKPAKYWTIPLINFVSKGSEYVPSLANHPLRIFPDAPLPIDIPEENKQMAEYVVRQKSRLIVFDFNNEKGFIETLPDYEEIVDRLDKRQIASSVTSVMVGSIGSNSIEADDFERWFPFYFLDLLGLATGSEISTLWIEYRDIDGKLVRRIHGSFGFGRYLFIKGHVTINNTIHHGGIGRLLSVAQNCVDLNEAFLRVSIRHTILGGRTEQSVEDKLDHFCRALDALCEYYRLAKQNLLSYTAQPEQNIIQQAIQQATSVVNSCAIAADSKRDFAQSRYLHTVIGRLANVSNQERKFGLAICDLLKIFNLPDADLLDAYFVISPRKDGIKKWADLISYYRGRVIHTGYFNFRDSLQELDDVWNVIQHLQDILLRILFSILGYDGHYQPPVWKLPVQMSIDWVKADTPPEKLGY
jgi:hypothetical protein